MKKLKNYYNKKIKAVPFDTAFIFNIFLYKEPKSGG